MRSLLAAFALTILGAMALPRTARAQANAYRFEITTVGDSTFAFPVRQYSWVHAGLRGIAVDPMRHDALVARFEIVRVDSGQAVATITGQTTQLTTDHVALVERPRTPWFKQPLFWLGTVLGAAVGAVAASR